MPGETLTEDLTGERLNEGISCARAVGGAGRLDPVAGVNGRG